MPSVSRLRRFAPAKSVRLSNVWLKSALVRLAPSSSGIGQIRAPDRSAPAGSRAGKRRGSATIRRAAVPRARLTEPPFMVPICRSAARLKPDRVGHRGGSFAAPIVPRPWPAAQDFHMFGVGQCYEGDSGKEMGPVSREERYLDCVTAP